MIQVPGTAHEFEMQVHVLASRPRLTVSIHPGRLVVFVELWERGINL